MNIRLLRKEEVGQAGELLYEVYGRLAEKRGYPPPWISIGDATELVRFYLASPGDAAIVADEDGRIAAIGFMRRRGEIATVGPIAVAAQGQGTGSLVLEELIQKAEQWGCLAARLYQDAWNPSSFAFHAGRSFAVVDLVARIERPASPAPKIDSARGLEISQYCSGDLPDVVTMDLRLTGLERSADLAKYVRLVARRKGNVVGFLAHHQQGQGGLLGPALALDVADLGGLIARALGDLGSAASARLSTAAPLALPAALALGFRIVELGAVMSRGLTPPARPPQLYSVLPEVM